MAREQRHLSARWLTAPAVALGVAVGALTAYAQGWLGDSVSSLANSAGPWSVAAFVAARRARSVAWAAVLGALTLWCCEIGYASATVVRGDSNATSTVVFWLIAGALAGPPLGIAAHWSRRNDWRGPAGCAVLPGVLIGEGIYGWTTVADTTDWRYWAIETAIGVVAAIAIVALMRPRKGWIGVPVTGLVAAVVFVVARSAG